MNGSGGGGEQPHPSGGEFLLQLLQKPRTPNQPQTPRPQSQSPTQLSNYTPQSVAHDPAVAAVHDPAVAAVGLPFPFLPWQSNGSDLTHPVPGLPRLPPPCPPHLLGFPQNPPWSLPQPQPGSPCNNDSNIGHGSHQLPLNQGVKDNPEGDIQHFGLGGADDAGNSGNRTDDNLMFGSFPCEIRTPGDLSKVNSVFGSYKGGVSSKSSVLNEREIGNGSLNVPVRDQPYERTTQNSYEYKQNGSVYGRPHPAFSRVDSNPPPKGVLNKPGVFHMPRESEKLGFQRHRRRFEHNVDRNINAPADLSRNVEKSRTLSHERDIDIHNWSDDLGFSEQMDHAAPFYRRKLHPASTSAVDGLNEQLRSTVQLDDGSAGNIDTKQKHDRVDANGRRFLSQRMRNINRQVECRNDIDRLNASFIVIYESLVPTEDEKAKQKQLVTSLEKLACKEWPGARLYLYGSCANSFGVSKSDIDVCLVIEDVDVDKSKVLLRLADILLSDNFENVQALTRARVPIVKLRDPKTGMCCDVCVNNILAVVNTKLLRDYAEIDLRLRQLAYIVKHWAKSRGVNETYRGTLSSYAYVIMCIHFLQQRRPAILPCLQGMKTTYSVTVEDVHCAFFDEVDKLRDFGSGNKETVAQLVWAFFNYWAYQHDYTNEVISVRTGSVISKREKDWTRRVGNDRHLICIEDPFEVLHDLGRVVDKFSIKVLREEFERAAHVMQHDPNPCITLFERYVPCS